MVKTSVGHFSLSRDGRPNSDAIGYLALPDGSIFLGIADGVGSASHGGDAARLAVATALELSAELDFSRMYSEISRRITAAATSSVGQWSSTLSVCRIFEDHADIGHVGDTRVYHLRGSGLQSRTRDQTEVEHLIDEGVLTRERALRYPRRNVLLSAMSNTGEFTLQQSSFDVQPNDRILLLSDGVHRQVTKQEITTLSAEHQEVENFVIALKEKLLERGIIDDSSAICAQIAKGI